MLWMEPPADIFCHSYIDDSSNRVPKYLKHLVRPFDDKHNNQFSYCFEPTLLCDAVLRDKLQTSTQIDISHCNAPPVHELPSIRQSDLLGWFEMMNTRIGSAYMPVDTHDTSECFDPMVCEINANQGSNRQMHYTHLYYNKHSMSCKPDYADAYGHDGPAAIGPGCIDPARGCGVR